MFPLRSVINNRNTTVRWTEEENERNLRKLFFAAAVDIPDPMLSNLAQTLVRIALKLLELLRAHRAAHGAGGGYVPQDAGRKTIGCRPTAISWSP